MTESIHHKYNSKDNVTIKKGLIKKITKYTKIMSISLSNSLVYVFDFLGRSVFFFIIIFIFLCLWKAIFAGEGNRIEGFTLETMIWYLLVTEIIALSSSRYYSEISQDVKTGNVAYMLNKPYNYVLYQFATHYTTILFNLTRNSVLAIIIGFLYVGFLPGFKLITLPFILLVILLGSAIDFFINFSLALSAFWVEENMPFRWIYQKLVFILGGMLLPLDLFPSAIKNVAVWLPFSFVAYGPAKVAVDFSMNRFSVVVLMQLLYLTVSIGIAFYVYNKGMKGVSMNGG